MRDGPRRPPLIALGALGAFVALILAGIYIYRESATSSDGGVVVDDRSCCAAGGRTTEVFTVDGAWHLRWSYDCSPMIRNQCDFHLTVKQMSDCQVSPENQGITQSGVRDHGVVHYQAGGTLYIVVGLAYASAGSWTVTVTGSGRASAVGPAPHCNDG
jgi:hypothetical protein